MQWSTRRRRLAGRGVGAKVKPSQSVATQFVIRKGTGVSTVFPHEHGSKQEAVVALKLVRRRQPGRLSFQFTSLVVSMFQGVVVVPESGDPLSNGNENITETKTTLTN